MDILHEIEIAIILFIQGMGDWLVGPMQGISVLGYEEFYLLIMPAIYWCMDSVLGFRMAVMLLLTSGLNATLKLAFHTPRPYWIDPQVRAFSSETSFGLPSGHAQYAASIWGVVAAALPGKWVKGFFILIIFLIGISRIFLGMHFLTDVLLGWLVGALLLSFFLKIEKRIWAWLRLQSLKQMLLLALFSAIALMLIPLLPAAVLDGWETPLEWKQTALAAFPGNEIDPLNISGAFTVSGTWLGLMAGAAWLYHKQAGFDTAGTPTQRLLRYWLGLAGVMILWFGLGQIFPRSADAVGYSLRFFRYLLIGLWITAAAPLVFQRIGLVAVHKKQKSSLSSSENPL